MKDLGPDFYNITDLLSEEELLIQKTAFEFVQTEFMPLINEHYEAGTFPLDLAEKLGDLGFFGSSLPHWSSDLSSFGKDRGKGQELLWRST